MPDDPHPAAAVPERQHVDPSALSAETTYRFVLLIIAVIASSAWIYFIITPPGPKEAIQIYASCFAAGPDVPAADIAPGGTYNDWLLAQQAQVTNWTRCVSDQYLGHAGWNLLGVVLPVTLALVIYWLLPEWRIRRRRLTPLGLADSPELVACLNDLVGVAGLAGMAKAPVFLLEPANPAVGGTAFGRRGREYVCLTGGLVTKFSTDLPVFRAVVLHELAHLRNGDVTMTYLAVAVWRAFVIATLLPLVWFVAPLAWSGLAAELGWRVVALTALVYFARNAVLRVREFHADATAASWDGDGHAWRGVLADLPSRQGTGWRWLRWLRAHPRPADRRHAADDPGVLFRLRFWAMFPAGMAVAIAFWSLLLPLGQPLMPHGVVAATQGLLLALAPLVAGVIAVPVWRAEAYALTSGRPMPGTVRAGLGFAAGTLVGGAVSLPGASAATARESLLPVAGADTASGLMLAGLTLLAVVGVVLLVGWIGCCARAWLPLATSGSVRWIWLASLAVTAMVVAGAMIWWWQAGYLIGSDLGSDQLRAWATTQRTELARVGWIGPSWLWATVWSPLALFVLPNDALLVAGTVLLWLFPSVAWLRSAPPRGPGVRFALLAGACAGVVSALLLAGLRVVAAAGRSSAVQAEPAFVLLHSYWQFGLTSLAQAVIAATVAGAASRAGRSVASSTVLGLLAAYVAAVLSTAGLLLSIVLGDCVGFLRLGERACPGSTDGNYASLALRIITVEGALAGLVAGLLAALLGAALGGLRRRARGREPPGQRHAELGVRKRAGLAAAITPAVLVVPAAILLAWGALTRPLPPGVESGQEAALFPRAPTKPPSVFPADTVVAAEAVQGWLRGGGFDRIGAIGNRYADFLAAAKRDDLPGARAACRALADEDVPAGRAFRAVPDTRAQEEWAAALNAVAAGATACVSALDRDDADLADEAMRQLLAGLAHLDAAQKRITAVVKADQGSDAQSVEPR
jgi:Zn-dependent protease with chaperone function